MTPERLAQIRTRVDAAYQGPLDVGAVGDWDATTISATIVGEPTADVVEATMDLFDHARADILDLLAEVERLRRPRTWKNGVTS